MAINNTITKQEITLNKVIEYLLEHAKKRSRDTNDRNKRFTSIDEIKEGIKNKHTKTIL